MKPSLLLLVPALIWLASPGFAATGRRAFPDSIRPVSGTDETGAWISRRDLSAEELGAPMIFSVSLRMRDVAGLQARVAAGEIVPDAEMEARYLPARADYDQLAAWLAAQGFTTELSDRGHTTIIVRGTVAQVAAALDVTFARVALPTGAASPGSEYTSAITTPSLPADLPESVLGIDGLQPHLQWRRPHPLPQDVVSNSSYVTPDDVAAGYNVSSNWNGRGQTIAIVDQGAVATSDLNTFWSTVGSSQTAANVTSINVAGGPSAGSDPTETALDVEWAGALAPGAQIRLYLSNNAINCLPQILNDLPTNPSMTVVSISYGSPEGTITLNSIASTENTLLRLAAAGVTVFAAAGDGGSNPSSNTGQYSASSPTLPEYPASDPSTTGVGGTTMTLNSSFVDTGETAWNAIPSQGAATGGGISKLISEPTWQTGTPSTTQRCVPDVAAIASGNNLGAFIYVTVGKQNPMQDVIGTSLATPIWAAVCAQLNQARAAVGLAPIGLLGPHIYPLVRTAAFTDITTGTNGAYSAGPGYDLCTGLGTPNVTNFIVALGGVPPPVISGQPQSTSVGLGVLFSFSVTATGSGLSYQWSLNGTPIAGATGSSYVKGAATTADAGSYTVTVSNAAGSVTSSAATLTITTPASAPAPASGGGGGGAPGLWFYAALLLLCGVRQATRSRVS